MKKMNSQFSARFNKSICFALILLLFSAFSSGLACSPKPATTPSSSSAIRYGNAIGNLANDGLVAQQGEWIYYSNALDEDKLYKIHIDGTQKQNICDDHARCLNVLDDWIYYVKDKYLFKIRTDGTQRSQISKEDYIDYVNVVDDWIYFSSTYLSAIYKIRTDGTEVQQLNQNQVSNLIVASNWVYYIKWDDHHKIYKMKTDGTEVQTLSQKVSSDINVINDWIFYSEGIEEESKLYKMKTDGTQKQYLNQNGCQCLNVVGEWIYFVDPNKNRHLYRIRTDGTQKQLLSDDRSWSLNILRMIGFITVLILKALMLTTKSVPMVQTNNSSEQKRMSR